MLRRVKAEGRLLLDQVDQFPSFGLRYEGRLPKLSLPFWRLGRKDVAAERLPPLELAGRGALEPLFRSGCGFHFRHTAFLCCYSSG